MTDIETFRGDDDAWQIAVTDTSSPPNPVDLTSMTGRAFYFTVKQQLVDGDDLILIQKSVSGSYNSGGGILVIPPYTTGIIRVNISHSDTERFIAPVTFHYDVRFKNNDGNIHTLVLGEFKILSNVARTVT